MIDLSDKKNFLSWLSQAMPLKQRESYWIINYLINHEAILNRVSFVHGALHTPRGILITDQTISGVGLEMVNYEEKIFDAEAIFYEIRKNRKEKLYLEVQFDQMHLSERYQLILEENEYLPMDEEEQLIFFNELDKFFEEESTKTKLNQLEEAIDLALEKNDQKSFSKLTAEYLKLKQVISS
ncbi:YpiB family protein [Vagococcus fluvialis]|uniref:YpiB family protein n=1 Tax=Vagococcus fluvialis TaxID=2738 RepID=UPI002034A309|nr:YpiB family protein [Vagococcus fluvialis]MCM2137669.1 YpiB family protein [Vagococcus fluvialis]MDR2277449.1 YpiB family protein [Vagococcus sp.]